MTEETTLNPDEMKKILKEYRIKEKEEKKNQERLDKIHSQEEWLWNLEYDSKGVLMKSITNYVDLLTKCPNLGQFCYDTYTEKRMYRDINGNEVEFSDSLYRSFYRWSEQYMSPCDMKKCETAMLTVSDDNSYNSGIQLLDSLSWDGVPRIETFFIDILGAKDTPLVREMTKQWLVGGVQRIYNPGCKNENVLILTGPQGCGKTTTLQWLSGKLGFDNNINLSGTPQDIGQKLQMCWFVCFDELATLSKRESADYKNWLSIETDIYRQPYGRIPEKHPRHNIYCGTTNETNFLRDNTDRTERRMWVIECNRTQKEWRETYHDRLTPELWGQIWSECVYIYKTTPDFCPYLSPELYDDFVEQQRQYKNYNSDETELLIEYLNKPYYLDKDGNFKDVDDMINQMKGTTTTPNGTSLQYINHIPQSYVSKIYTDILKQKRIDHNCMRNVLDGNWCVKKNKCRIGRQNLMFYIRGVWKSMEDDTVDRVFWNYTNQSDNMIDDMIGGVDGNIIFTMDNRSREVCS